jgi:GNAT superfamily N-acetyltransferase
MIIVRDMRAADAAAVAVLTCELGYESTEADIARRFDLIKERRDAKLLVAEGGAEDILGWIHMQATYLLESDPRAEISGLVVTEHARGTGAGRQLVEAGERWARSMGLDTVSVRSNQLRVAARGFYEHLDYRVVKVQNAFRKAL